MTAPNLGPPRDASRDNFFLAATLGALTLTFLIGVGVIAVVAAATGDGNPSGDADGGTVAVELSEFAISGELATSPGPVQLDVSNVGSQIHNLAIEGTDLVTADLDGGQSETLDAGELDEGSYVLFCEISGHREAGMEAVLTVGSGGEGEAASADHATGGANLDFNQMDEDMLASFQPFVDALESGEPNTEGRGNQLLEPTIAPDGAKEFELTAEIVDWEVEPGKVVEAWTYNGMVPSPMIKVDVGDTVRVRLRNELPLNTDIHWHGIQTPNDMDGVAPLTQDPVPPGGEFTYEFTVNKPHIGMYHPHLHGQMTVPNGMFGVFQVGETPVPRGQTINGTTIPEDLQLAVDVPMVLNDAGTIGLTLNGKSFPATDAIVMNQGEWGAITYYNEGLQVHPMHLHQFPQLVVAKDGHPLPQPYFTDTLLVSPGERYTVVFQAENTGVWAYHCHILNHAERESGMFGMVTAVVVQ